MAGRAVLRRVSASLPAGAALTSGASIGGAGLSAIASIVIARELGVTQRGQWAVISSLALLVGTFATLGLPTAAGFGAARSAGVDRHRFVQATLVAGVLLAAAGAGVYALLSLVVAPAGVSRPVVLLGAAVAGTLVVFQVVHQIVLTMAPIGWFAVGQLLPPAGMLIAVVIAGAAGELDVGLVALFGALTPALGTAAALAGVWRHGALGSRRLLTGLRDGLAVLRPYVAFALMTFATLAMTNVVQRLDVLLIAGYRGSREAGLYAVAVQVGDVLLVVPSALGFLVFRLGAGSREGHWSQTTSAIRWTLVSSVLAASVVGVAAAPLVSLLFGSQYEASVTPLRWLLPGAVLLGVQGVISNYVASRGRPRSVLVAWLTAAIVALGLDLVAIPAFGISGAGAVSSISYLVVVLLHLRALEQVRPDRGAQMVSSTSESPGLSGGGAVERPGRSGAVFRYGSAHGNPSVGAAPVEPRASWLPEERAEPRPVSRVVAGRAGLLFSSVSSRANQLFPGHHLDRLGSTRAALGLLVAAVVLVVTLVTTGRHSPSHAESRSRQAGVVSLYRESAAPVQPLEAPLGRSLVAWNFSQGLPRGWSLYPGSTGRKSRGGLAIRTTTGRSAYQLDATSRRLPPGTYVAVVHGQILSGGMYVGVLKANDPNKWLKTADFWYGQSADRPVTMSVSVTLSTPNALHVVLANFSGPSDSSSSWLIRDVSIRRPVNASSCGRARDGVYGPGCRYFPRLKSFAAGLGHRVVVPVLRVAPRTSQTSPGFRTRRSAAAVPPRATQRRIR